MHIFLLIKQLNRKISSPHWLDLIISAFNFGPIINFPRNYTTEYREKVRDPRHINVFTRTYVVLTEKLPPHVRNSRTASLWVHWTWIITIHYRFWWFRSIVACVRCAKTAESFHDLCMCWRETVLFIFICVEGHCKIYCTNCCFFSLKENIFPFSYHVQIFKSESFLNLNFEK